jgi:bla regulator protein blaR1
MTKNWARNLTQLAATAAAMLLAASVAPFLAQAQSGSKYPSDIYTLISRDDGSSVVMHLQGEGDHCWGTTSDDRGIGISIGDDLCTVRDEGEDSDAAMYARISANQISFRLDGKAYTISDAATVKQARGLFAPLVSIEEQQDELGAKERALGDKQRNLGEQQRDVKVPIPDMSADFQKVEADAKRLSVQGGTQSELGDLQSELGDLQSRLGDLQSQAGDAQSQLGDKQSALGDQQSALGDQQSKLGDESERLAKGIASKLRGILNQSVQNGTAKSK